MGVRFFLSRTGTDFYGDDYREPIYLVLSFLLYGGFTVGNFFLLKFFYKDKRLSPDYIIPIDMLLAFVFLMFAFGLMIASKYDKDYEGILLLIFGILLFVNFLFLLITPLIFKPEN